MRELLFRGKRISDGEWLYGIYADETVCDVDFPCIMPLVSGPHTNNWSVDKETVGQFTGLYDSNGKKIFEGDILSAYFDDEYPENETRAEVRWIEHGWHTVENECKPDVLDGAELWAVVGNVYDNPEMVEEVGDND